ncbi:MAG: sugar isomerase [Planctomycetota bacterium]|jgi:6-phospho-3-hexuloisomerase|nr:sugar isomerase [Planctomycetota bacterium]
MEYMEIIDRITAENRETLARVDPREIDRFLEAIMAAKSVQLCGIGRMKMSVRGFAMRLKHMGFDSYVVYDTTTPVIGPGDLLIVHAGLSNVELNVMRLAKDAGAKIALVSAHPDNEHGKLADVTVKLPGQIFGAGDEVKSIQPMASLMEQALLLFTDALVLLLVERANVNREVMYGRHTNLEGINADFA